MTDLTAVAPSPGRDVGQLDSLISAIRHAVTEEGDWSAVAQRVAAAIAGRLPDASILAPHERTAPADGLTTHCLHVEPDGSFSLVAFVCDQHQETPIHDHVTWCVFGVVAGEPVEDYYAVDPATSELMARGRRTCPVGTVDGAAPPGDIHRLGNPHPETAISLHVYGTDISRIGTSVRRVYEAGRSPSQ